VRLLAVRSGAIPPNIVEAWPPSPGSNYRPSPPILGQFEDCYWFIGGS
jgi:hypothetical protein